MRFTLLALGLSVPALAFQIPQGATGPSNPTDLKSLTLEQFTQIQVTTPTKEPQQAFRSPVAIYVIRSEDIRRSGATSIPEALRLAPGVEVQRIDAGRWSIGIRGFGSRLTRSVLVLIDGREVYTTLFAGTYWEARDVEMNDIDRIEVIRGPGGVICGPSHRATGCRSLTRGERRAPDASSALGSSGLCFHRNGRDSREPAIESGGSDLGQGATFFMSFPTTLVARQSVMQHN